MEMKENREKMAALVRMLRRDINGAVVERMEQLGIRYECNWGSACMPSGVRPPCSRPTTLLPGFFTGRIYVSCSCRLS